VISLAAWDGLEDAASAPTNEKTEFDACMIRMYGRAVVTRPAPARPGARRRRPIQLATLRGFEAAARLLSFTLAADELALTQSSISRQISALERQVGRPLFVRRTRALEFTEAGERLYSRSPRSTAASTRSVASICRRG
jgi:LysR family transcriptional regulator, glycine cleavage system transcriptional activator